MSLPKPYYDEGGITIFHGDCRDILPQLGDIETIITDPVWPNAPADIGYAGADNPGQLFKEMCKCLPRNLERLVVQMG